MAPTLTERAPVVPQPLEAEKVVCSPALSIADVPIKVTDNIDLLLSPPPARGIKIESIKTPIDSKIDPKIDSTLDKNIDNDNDDNDDDDEDPQMPELVIPAAHELVSNKVKQEVKLMKKNGDNSPTATVAKQRSILALVECDETLQAKIEAHGLNNLNGAKNNNNILRRIRSNRNTPDLNYVFGFLLIFFVVLLIIGLCIYFKVLTLNDNWKAKFDTSSAWTSKL